MKVKTKVKECKYVDDQPCPFIASDSYYQDCSECPVVDLKSIDSRNKGLICPYDCDENGHVNMRICEQYIGQNYDGSMCNECDIYKENYPFEHDEEKREDLVNHPSHYTNGKFECIDVIIDILTWHRDPVAAWFTGQVVKYIWRWPLKNGLEDLKKAQFYLNRLIVYLEEETEGK